MGRLFVLAHDLARKNAMTCVQQAPAGYIVKVQAPTRNLEQNAAQWPILEAFAEQKEWPVNGKLERLTPNEWKDILTAAFERETVRVAMGLDGGVVMLGSRTSSYSKQKFYDWLSFLNSTAADRGVNLVYELNDTKSPAS